MTCRSCPDRDSALPTPKYALRRRSSSSISRVWLRWVCVSMIAGITVLPARFTRLAPAGTRIHVLKSRAAFLSAALFSLLSISESIARSSSLLPSSSRCFFQSTRPPSSRVPLDRVHLAEGQPTAPIQLSGFRVHLVLFVVLRPSRQQLRHDAV